MPQDTIKSAPSGQAQNAPRHSTPKIHNDNIASVITANAQYGHIPGLDGLRAFAVLIVMIAHMGFEHIVPGGFGVTVFFFISGFLITRLLVAETESKGQVTLSQFYVRRFIRLYPALLFMMYLTGCMFIIMKFGVPSWAEIASGIGYTTNILQTITQINGNPPLMPWTHLWSLAVEEHFYLAFPILLIVMRNNWRALSLALVGIIVACLAWRFFIAFGTNLPIDTYNYMMTDTRIDSLAWGCLFSVALHRAGSALQFKNLIGFIPTLIGIAGLALSFLIRDDVFRYTVRFTIQGASLFILILNLYHWKFLSFAFLILDFKPLARIGTLSYALYLWHVPLIDICVRTFGNNMNARIFAIALSFAIAAFSFQYVEKPFLKFRKRFGSHAAGKPKVGNSNVGKPKTANIYTSSPVGSTPQHPAIERFNRINPHQ